ncbi:TIGR00341 family protein [Desulfopila sp. IMCC35008]|uniref:TIGR00341 family protein n=1 Tax=Desulfopila sp. IMCC35008 TaxID=2653858 RepID=UPI0013D4744F|nr:TIGR00341 family protein [Desulfopila sp. IMCC35008]
MTIYVSAALFVYGPGGEQHRELVEQNSFGINIKSVSISELIRNKEQLFSELRHVVVCGALQDIKAVLHYSHEFGFSIGIIPLPHQLQLKKSYGLPGGLSDALELALRNNPSPVDIVFCNDKILMFKGSVGQVPLIDNPEKDSKYKILVNGFRRLLSLHLFPFTFTTFGTNKAKVTTAASGILLFENPKKSFATKLVSDDLSLTDRTLSMLVVAPLSVVAYLQLMILRLFSGYGSGKIPDSIGYIKSPHLLIESNLELNVKLDGTVETSTPLECKVVSDAVRVNHGRDKTVTAGSAGKEKSITHTLPTGKELLKVGVKRVPFFTYASEERFKDLFISLREDGRIDSKYVVLMALSTVLATIGLYLDSGSVVIGAMLLAPLMAPIISMAMSILRFDRKLFKQSFYKISLGVFIALFISALFTMVLHYHPFTAEMQARLNPTMLDLFVAIAAGIAGAYTKSYKEILQSLAGVAIAVALVPPLAVAGIGLGRMEFLFFQQAFLLFSTNLIGIILAATLSFRVLGFSPVVRDKRGMLVVLTFLIAISVPLFMGFQSIVTKARFEKSWKKERFLVNEKYLIVNTAKLHEFRDKNLLIVDIHAREPLNRYDLTVFKQKIQQNFAEDLQIRARIIYIP